MEETGMSSEECRMSLIRSNWNIEEAKG
jgi:hypothetical protein